MESFEMGYDIHVGTAFESSQHAFTFGDQDFGPFVREHQRAVLSFKLVSRIKDEYGDADFLVSEVGALAAELLELEQQCERPEVRAVCKKLRVVAQSAHAQKLGIFCRGD